MASARTSQQVFFGSSALLFAASAALTIAQCGAMSRMGTMPMPGGWTMSMTWTRMPGQTWATAAESFLVMWVVMMTAMMLPSLVPMLRRYRHAVRGTSRSRLDGLTSLAGLGYFSVWTLFGLLIFPLGVLLTTTEMKLPALARSVPVDVGAIIALAGVLQFTQRKAYHLACCRETPGPSSTLPAEAGAAWQQGVDL